MHILDKIVSHKKQEVERQKLFVTTKDLEQRHFFKLATRSMKAAITAKEHGGIIAEFKKKSPSKQNINLDAVVTEVVSGYEQAGAAGISVLTDENFFGGTQAYLLCARSTVGCPLLRKDFIIDSYQILEAKALGADIILLIARILTKKELQAYTSFAHELGLEVLVEIHNQEELDICPADMDIIGVNNRNLDTFQVDYQNSIRLMKQLPESVCKISESGILDKDTMVMLRRAGFDGFLIGEHFMRSADPGLACATFISEYENKLTQKA